MVYMFVIRTCYDATQQLLLSVHTFSHSHRSVSRGDLNLIASLLLSQERKTEEFGGSSHLDLSSFPANKSTSPYHPSAHAMTLTPQGHLIIFLWMVYCVEDNNSTQPKGQKRGVVGRQISVWDSFLLNPVKHFDDNIILWNVWSSTSMPQFQTRV